MATVEALREEEALAIAGAECAEIVDMEDYRAKSRGSEGPGYTLFHGSVEVPGTSQPVDYTGSFPDEPQDPHIHLVVPGYGGFKRTSRKLRTALAQNEEVAAVSYDPARHGGIMNDLLHPQQVHADTIAAIAQDLADNEALHELPATHDLDFNQLVLVPHSMGGLAVAKFVLDNPQGTSRMIMIATVGNEAAVKLGFIPRLGRSAKNEILPAILHRELGGLDDGAVMAWRALKYYGSNLVRTTGEAASCMLADQRDAIETIVAHGVKTALYLPAEDELIPAEPSAEGIGAIVDHFEIARGLNHLAPQTRYERVAADMSRISSQLLLAA